MLKVYGSRLCRDCVNFKANCDQYGIAYDYSDITEELSNLKEFLKYRDENPVFEDAKKAGGIGIPAIIKEDGTITLDWKAVVAENGFEPFETLKCSCSLNDRSGC
ncbi:MAG: glutaredoxin [Bulleidia sp.]